jgi:hypothetical protein
MNDKIKQWAEGFEKAVEEANSKFFEDYAEMLREEKEILYSDEEKRWQKAEELAMNFIADCEENLTDNDAEYIPLEELEKILDTKPKLL